MQVCPILTKRCHIVVAEHWVEEGSASDNELDVEHGILLEQDLEDRDHHNDVADCHGDECQGFNYHLHQGEHENRDGLHDQEESEETTPCNYHCDNLDPVE